MKIARKRKSLRKKTMRKGGNPNDKSKNTDSLALMEEGMSPIKVTDTNNFSPRNNLPLRPPRTKYITPAEQNELLRKNKEKRNFVIGNTIVPYKQPINSSKVFSGDYVPSGVVKQDLKTSERQKQFDDELDDADDDGINFGGKKTRRKSKPKKKTKRKRRIKNN
jgi:hypothetical protein